MTRLPLHTDTASVPTATAALAATATFLAAAALGLAAPAALADIVPAPLPETHVSPAGHAFTLLPVEEADYVHVSLYWPGADALARPGKEGLRTLAVRLPFEEAGGRRMEEIAEDLTDAGANVMMVVTLPGPQVILQAQKPDALASAAATAHDLLTDATLAEEDLDWLKGDIADGLAEDERDPDNLLDRALGVLLANGDRRLASITNRPVSTVDAVTTADVADWMAASFDAEPVAVAVGPLTPQEAGAAIDTVLANLGPRAAPVPLEPIRIRAEAVTAVIDAPEAETALVGVSFPVSPVDPAVTVALDALAGGDGTRLFRRLRETDGATYGVDLVVTPLLPELMTAALIASVPPERAEETLAALREEVALIRTGGVTEAELAAARERMAAQETAFLRDPAALASIAIDQVTLGQPISPEARRESDDMQDLAAINAALAGAVPAEIVGVIVTPRPDLVGGDCFAVTPEELTECNSEG